MEEKYESCEVELDGKICELASMIQSSRKVVVHTGAGISTPCGIPDYRGPQGVWTLKDKGINVSKFAPHPVFPSRAHMGLSELVSKEFVHYVVSQNTDGLHIQSGIPPEKISELHGNKFKEVCTNRRCRKVYFRQYPCRKQKNGYHQHRTGRRCDSCTSPLRDSIVNFDEDLPSKPLNRAERHSEEADLCIVFGSSLKVTPASELPFEGYPKCKVAIVNLQETPMDNKASLRIYEKCDKVMEELLQKLSLSVPPYIARATISFRFRRDGTMCMSPSLGGMVQSVQVDSSALTKKKDRLEWKVSRNVDSLKFQATISFADQRPLEPLTLNVALRKGESVDHSLCYRPNDPSCSSWTVDCGV